MHYRKNFGFTLIELLVVIAIIGFLATTAMVAYTTVKMKGRNTKRHADTGTIQKALGLYQTRTEKYPTANPGVCLDGTPVVDTVSPFLVTDLPKMPTDPTAKSTKPSPLPSNGVATAPHCYYYYTPSATDGSTYTLQYYIEGEGVKTRTP